MGSRKPVIRANRLGGGPTNEFDRGGPAEPRHQVSYWCAALHESRPRFAVSVEVPETWPCHTCGNPAGQSREAPPPAPARTPVHKTPLEFLQMRRSDEEGEQLLEEALGRLRANRRA